MSHVSKTLFFCKTLFNKKCLLVVRTKLFCRLKNLHICWPESLQWRNFTHFGRNFGIFVQQTVVNFTSTISHNRRKWVETQSKADERPHGSEKYYRLACGKCTAKIRSTVFWQCVIKLYNYVNRTDNFLHDTIFRHQLLGM